MSAKQQLICIIVCPDGDDAVTIMDQLKTQATAAGATGNIYRSADFEQAEEEARLPTLLDQWEA